MKILAIETSCDDTSVAILENNVIHHLDVIGQKSIHEKFGGIVPENASRAHLEILDALVEGALHKTQFRTQDIDLVAVTRAPGLLGSLLVGVTYARALAASLQIPCIGVHHLEGHLAAPWLAAGQEPQSVPCIGLVVSGGHTHFYRISQWGQFTCVGRTLDDAVGECFDKLGRVLGYGFPAGPVLNALAEEALAGQKHPNPLKPRSRYQLPRPWPGRSWRASGDMSFSGLKTAVQRLVTSGEVKTDEDRRELALGLHEAIGEVLIRKLTWLLEKAPDTTAFALTGGVAANSLLRQWFEVFCRENGLEFWVAPPRLCTDNAAMIGFAAYLRVIRQHTQQESWEAEAVAVLQ